MFKGAIIEDDNFYKLKRISIYLGIFGSFGYLIIHFLEKGNYLSMALGFLLIISIYFFQYKLADVLKTMSKNKTIEIDTHKLSILSSSSKTVIAEHDFSDYEKIHIDSEFLPSEEQPFKSIRSKDKKVANSIILEKGDLKHQFEFTIDSYYMAEQLKKLNAKFAL
jgi:hypothetical protein